MPFYQWKCKKCDAIVEELRKVDDFTPPTSCNKCGEQCACGKGPCEFEQLLTTANFRIDSTG